MKDPVLMNKMIKIFSKMYEVIHKICEDNNLAKAQIFKGDGVWHLINLYQRIDISTALFL